MDCSMPVFLSFTILGSCSNSCLLSRWCHPTISSSVASFSCFPSFPEAGSFPMSQLFASGGQSIGASASASVLPVNSQGWFLLGLTGLLGPVNFTDADHYLWPLPHCFLDPQILHLAFFLFLLAFSLTLALSLFFFFFWKLSNAFIEERMMSVYLLFLSICSGKIFKFYWEKNFRTRSPTLTFLTLKKKPKNFTNHMLHAKFSCQLL